MNTARHRSRNTLFRLVALAALYVLVTTQTTGADKADDRARRSGE